MGAHDSHDMHENSLAAWVGHDSGTREEAVMQVYLRHGPRSDREVLDCLIGAGVFAATDDMNLVRPAITKLIKDGQLVEGESITDTVSGRLVRQCRVATSGDIPPKQFDEGIVRIKRRELPFVMVDKSLAENSDLSFRARGLMLWLLAKPDDWHVYSTYLHKHAKEGRDACLKAFNELISAGYVVKGIDTSGDQPRVTYSVHEVPVTGNPERAPAPVPENPVPENPVPENPELPNNHSTKETKQREPATTIDEAMGEIERQSSTTIPEQRSPKDLQTMRLVRLVKEQDFIDTHDLIAEFGWDRVVEAAERMRKARGGSAPFPSEIAGCLRTPIMSRPKMVERVRRALRDKYQMDTYIPNALLDDLILRGSGVRSELEACMAHHGKITKEWIDDCIKAGTITLAETERSNEWLAKQVESLG